MIWCVEDDPSIREIIVYALNSTGLGLSIVKHAVQYPNARMELQSTPGAGTKITISF